MPNATKPKCPACGSGKHKRMNDTIKCLSCGGLYDDDPAEGGSHGNNPSSRLEYEERRREGRQFNRRR